MPYRNTSYKGIKKVPIAQLEERHLDVMEVTGSNPVGNTKGSMVKLVSRLTVNQLLQDRSLLDPQNWIVA
jgi:hypothetical protein